MARSINKVILIGNLGEDPEVRYTGSGVAVATFSMATTERWTGQDGQPSEATYWHKIIAWRKLAEICGEYLKKGSKVYVEGKITYRSWEKDGIKKTSTEIVIDQLVMLDGKKSEDTPETVAAAPAAKDDDLPF